MRRWAQPAILGAMIRCLIVDDSPTFLDTAISVLCRDGLDVVGTAGTIEQALRQAERLLPDTILVDITLGEESGFDLVRRLTETASDAAIILISTHAEADFAELIAETPAVGFVPKSELSAESVRRLVTEHRDR
jgi:DNA-binding NarL/FixJ family response regulator